LWFDFLQDKTAKLDTTGAILGKLVAYEVITPAQREDIEENSITLLQVRFMAFHIS